MKNKTFEKKVTKKEFFENCIDELKSEIDRAGIKSYSIQVDGSIPYYPQSSNDIFNLKRDFKNPNEISIRFFFGNSKNYQERIYKFEKEKETTQNQFGGFGAIESTMVGKSLGQILQESENKNKLEWENTSLKEKISNLEKELKDSEKIEAEQKRLLEKYEDKIDDLEKKNQTLSSTNYMQLAQVGVPILAGLGILKPEVTQMLTGQSLGSVANEEDKALIEQGKWIDETFENVKVEFSEMLDILGDNPTLVPQILHLLKQQQQAQ